jgi:hypothetical protein
LWCVAFVLVAASAIVVKQAGSPAAVAGVAKVTMDAGGDAAGTEADVEPAFAERDAGRRDLSLAEWTELEPWFVGPPAPRSLTLITWASCPTLRCVANARPVRPPGSDDVTAYSPDPRSCGGSADIT